MKKQTAIILLTVSGFGAGLGTGLWIGLGRVPATPPPAWLFNEFKSITKPGSSLQNLVQSRPDLWREINAELYDLKPQIDEFRERLHDIDTDFRRDFEAILTETQIKKLTEAQLKKELPRINVDFRKKVEPVQAPGAKTPEPVAAAKPAAPASTAPANTTPAPAATAAKPATAPQIPADKQPRMYQENADGLVASLIFIPFNQQRFIELLDLNSDQQSRLHELLLIRRDRFLKLCDDTPPPSLQLHRIAEIIRRAEAEKK